MKKLLAVVLFLMSGWAVADTLQAQDEDTTIILFAQECDVPALKTLLKDNGFDVAAKASVTYKGEIRQACWVPIVDNTGEKVVAYGVVDEKGGNGVLDAEYFHKVRDI